MVRAVMISVVLLAAGVANAKLKQYCGYPFGDEHGPARFETIITNNFETIDISTLPNNTSLLNHEGYCTCVNAEISQNRNGAVAFSMINADSAVRVKPTANNNCIRLQQETTIEDEFRDANESR